MTRNIILICDGVSSPANAGSLFRLADAFGVTNIIFCESNFDINSNRLKRMSRNTHTTVTHTFENNTTVEIQKIKEKGIIVIGLEITDASVKISEAKNIPGATIALVIGNEKNGIQKHVLSLLDTVYHIPMFGKNSSMNVSHATAIALYELSMASHSSS